MYTVYQKGDKITIKKRDFGDGAKNHLFNIFYLYEISKTKNDDFFLRPQNHRPQNHLF